MPLVFFHGPYEAGVFTGETYPQEPGIYAYEPIEGVGHEEMQAARRLCADPRCHYDADGIRTSFTVHSSPRYGRIELTDFERSPVPAS
jgi:hypothetical protein